MEQMQLTADFREFLSLLASESIDYLLIGGYAVALHGYVRPTKDMDIWISLATENLAGVVRVLEKFGFSKGSVTPETFTAEQSVIRMGVPPYRIEILTKIAGVTFEECRSRRQVMDLDGVSVSVISFEDLCTNKLSAARLKDRADVEQLRLQRGEK